MAKNQQNDNLLALEKERKKIVSEILKLREAEIQAIIAGGSLDKKEIIKLNNKKKLLANIVEKIKEENGLIKDQVSSFENAASSIKSMSDLQSTFKKELNNSALAGADLASKIGQVGGANKKSFKEANELIAQGISSIAELSQLNAEDAVEIRSKTNDIEASIASLNSQITQLEANRQNMSESEASILNSFIKQRSALENQLTIAGNQANISKEIKDTYEELMTDLNGLEKTFKKIVITTQIFFSSFKNAAGMSLMFIGGLVDGFNELAKGVGGTVGQMFQLKAQSFAVSKLLGDDAAKGVTSLAEKLGDANDVTLDMSLGVGALSGRLGVSGEEAATLANMFGNLSKKSTEVAFNTMEAASNLASANGVAPSGVMKDIAENTEFFALHSKDGGSNIAEAAVQAKRLGVDLSTASKISGGLLDFQSSVASEMEASVILGKNINLNKARELAFAGDSAGAMKEAIKQAGTLAELEAMNPIEREALAKAIGVSNAELMQMVANEKKALTPIGKLEGSFDSVSATARELGATFMGTAVKGIGGMLIGMKDFKKQVRDAKEGAMFLKDSIKGVFGMITGKKGAGFKGIFDSQETSAIKGLGKSVTPASDTPSRRRGGNTGNNQKQMAGGFTAMGQPGVSMGILNTALAGPALLLFALGTPGMMAISSLGKNTGKGLLGLATGLMAFSAVPLLAVGVLAATAGAFTLMTLGSIGLAAVALGGVAAGAGLEGLAVGLTAIGVAAMTGVPFAGVALIGAFGVALMPLTSALSSLAPLVTSIGQAISIMFTSMANAFVLMETSLPNLIANFLPLIGMIGSIFTLSFAITALSISLLALGAASVVALPALAVIGFAAGAGFGMGGGEVSAGGGQDTSLLSEIQGLRSDIKQLAVVVNLDNRQIYRGHVQNVKNNS